MLKEMLFSAFVSWLVSKKVTDLRLSRMGPGWFANVMLEDQTTFNTGHHPTLFAAFESIYNRLSDGVR